MYTDGVGVGGDDGGDDQPSQASTGRPLLSAEMMVMIMMVMMIMMMMQTKHLMTHPKLTDVIQAPGLSLLRRALLSRYFSQLSHFMS